MKHNRNFEIKPLLLFGILLLLSVSGFGRDFKDGPYDFRIFSFNQGYAFSGSGDCWGIGNEISTINSTRTKLSLTIPDKPFNYKLKTLFSEISMPGLTVIKDDFYEKKTSDQIPTLELNTSYCPIKILTEKNP